MARSKAAMPLPTADLASRLAQRRESAKTLEELDLGYGPLKARSRYAEAVAASRRQEMLQPGLRRPRTPSPRGAARVRAKALEQQEDFMKCPLLLPGVRPRVWVPRWRCVACKRKNFGFRKACSCAAVAPPSILALQERQAAVEAAISLDERLMMLRAEADSLKLERHCLELDKEEAIKKQEELRLELQTHRGHSDLCLLGGQSQRALALKRSLARRLFEAKKRLRTTTTTR